MASIRNYPLLLTAGLCLLLASFVGLAAVLGKLPAAPKDSAAATPPAVMPKTAEAAAAKKANCRTCGVIASVKRVELQGETSGVGAVAGGVAGAVVGHEIGEGKLRPLLTVAGAAGGALAGNEIERHAKKRVVYRVVVRMDDGSERVLNQAQAPAWGVGARVRVNGSALERA